MLWASRATMLSAVEIDTFLRSFVTLSCLPVLWFNSIQVSSVVSGLRPLLRVLLLLQSAVDSSLQCYRTLSLLLICCWALTCCYHPSSSPGDERRVGWSMLWHLRVNRRGFPRDSRNRVGRTYGRSPAAATTTFCAVH